MPENPLYLLGIQCVSSVSVVWERGIRIKSQNGPAVLSLHCFVSL